MRQINPAKPVYSRKFFQFNRTVLAILVTAFVLGTGVGIAIGSTVILHPANVASREFIDANAPNRELCAQFGASAIATDVRFFVTMNPFNVFVSQPSLKPGCVLRMGNWAILEQQGLVTSEQVRDCRNRMNTFGFTGELQSSPDIRCIYQNDSAENFFLNQPGAFSPPKETEKF